MDDITSPTDNTIKLANLLNSDTVRNTVLPAIHRADLLPANFKIRGKPYSLVDYPQFREMYSSQYVPDTLFISGRQLGKSINLSRSEIYDMLSIPHFQILYVAPLQAQAQRYSTLYLKEAINTCMLATKLQTFTKGVQSGPVIQSVHHQALSNGSGIQLTYAKTSSDRARGIYADRIDFDEIQDQLVDTIPIISESMTSSSWQIRRFTGTAKTTDNTIEALWLQSSMCEWAMKCTGCGYWNIPDEDHQVLELVLPTGVHCVKCRKKLNVRDGQFVPRYRDRMNLFRGYHIPQIVIPALVENPHKWASVVRKFLKWPVSLIKQEILGISCSTGARLISQQDIDAVSVLPTTKELQKTMDHYVLKVGGVDWGVAEHTSFTVHTIIGVKPDGTIHCLWAKRFIGFDPEETLAEIAKAHTFYNCSVLAADFGMGYDKNIMLESRFGLPVVQIMYVRQNKLLSYLPLHGHARWTVDKTTALDILFLAIKYRKILFPTQTEFKIYTDDLLSCYEEVIDKEITSRRYLRNPNHPDDFTHALCFASMAAMRLINTTMVDLIPQGSLGVDRATGVPDINHLDPSEVMASIRV